VYLIAFLPLNWRVYASEILLKVREGLADGVGEAGQTWLVWEIGE